LRIAEPSLVKIPKISAVRRVVVLGGQERLLLRDREFVAPAQICVPILKLEFARYPANRKIRIKANSRPTA
jgi:hypothetical protein